MKFGQSLVNLALAVSTATAGATDQYDLFEEPRCVGLISTEAGTRAVYGGDGCMPYGPKLRRLAKSARITYEGIGPLFFYSDVNCTTLIGQSYKPSPTGDGTANCVTVKLHSPNTIKAMRLSDCMYGDGAFGGGPCGPTTG